MISYDGSEFYIFWENNLIFIEIDLTTAVSSLFIKSSTIDFSKRGRTDTRIILPTLLINSLNSKISPYIFAPQSKSKYPGLKVK